ncbi:hypothetical protein IVA96_15640 [Bradyrhizobium sp. 159]|uniref:hypothetical protein n=1 Tax=Bradyrhizobium sp. 159 TaxID=2782632 RepID=UPI001FF9674A|nr:hypothetical protein [Bradyrhizobium sp. 159]MCK1618051.1 hypothetical protein [Bradyrhizobium sp. 159]
MNNPDDLRDEGIPGQAKQRRAKRDTRRTIVTLEQLPLFADERSLSEAVLGHGSYTHWRAIVLLLERRGFPKIDGLMGGRYTRAVRAFFDHEYGLHGAPPVLAPHRSARLGASHQAADLGAAWKKRDLYKR